MQAGTGVRASTTSDTLTVPIVLDAESAGAYAPLWERSYDDLSEGEQVRVDLARAGADLAVLADQCGRPDVAEPLVQHLRHLLGRHAEGLLDEARQRAEARATPSTP
jgi:ABC-type hemin transport system ATPase subunit